MQIEYRDSEESKVAGITYHLTVQDEWTAQKDGDFYVPSAYDADGFIHCTNGLELLTKVANMFYKNSPEQRVILVLDMKSIESDVRYDDPDQTFPHVYGPLNPSAVIAELPVSRDSDGTFTRMGTS